MAKKNTTNFPRDFHIPRTMLTTTLKNKDKVFLTFSYQSIRKNIQPLPSFGIEIKSHFRNDLFVVQL